jgi:hypothetical protein
VTAIGVTAIDVTAIDVTAIGVTAIGDARGLGGNRQPTITARSERH